MKTYWQEILTFVIVGVAVYYLLRRYLFPPKNKGVGAAACEPCSTASCEGCAVLDLKEEIAMKRDAADIEDDSTKSTKSNENQAGNSDSDSHQPGTSSANDAESGSADESPEVVDNDSDEGEEPPMKRDYLSQCLDGCIQARRMGLK